MALRSSPLTPQFRFDPAKGRYIDARGRIVSARAVRGALDDYLQTKTAQVRELSEQLRRREVSIAEWQRGMERELARIHLASAAAAKGGWARMDQSDYGRVGGLLRREYRYLDRMARQMEAGLPLDGHFLLRCDQYAEAGRHTYHVVETAEMRARGMDEERSIRHATDSCWECLLQELLGWRPIESGEIKQPGDRVCRRKCKCGKEYRNSLDQQTIAERTEPNIQAASRAVDNQAEKGRKKRIDAVLKEIDGIHRVENLPRLPARVIPLKGLEGGLDLVPGTGVPKGFVFNRSADHLELTVAHEMGHLIDLMSIGTPHIFASNSSEEMAAFRAVVDQSKSVRELRKFLKQGQAPSDADSSRIVPIVKAAVEDDLTYHEIWARAYAQYIARKSSSPAMKEQLLRLQIRRGYSKFK